MTRPSGARAARARAWLAAGPLAAGRAVRYCSAPRPGVTMPIAGLSLMFLVQIALVVHALRTGRNTLWIWVLVLLPPFGVIAYVIIELWPEVAASRRVRRGLRDLQRVADPNRDLRAAAADAAVADTVVAKLRLAEQQLRRGDAHAAIATYRSGLRGLYEHDPALLSGLAGAQYAAGDLAGARASLELLTAHAAAVRSPDAHVLYARVLAELGDLSASEREFRAVAAYYPGAEAKVRHARLLKQMGQAHEAEAIFADVLRSAAIAPRHVRRAQSEWIRIAEQERAR
jgi:hypothetical protein